MDGFIVPPVEQATIILELLSSFDVTPVHETLSI